MKARYEDLLAMLRMIDLAKPEEIDCDQFLAAVSGYIEKLGSGVTAPLGYDELLHHLRVCPECLEEFEALYRAYQEGI